jgi:hypothetical protein
MIGRSSSRDDRDWHAGGMPQSDHETIASVAVSATGQYLKPILERASTKPVIVATTPKRPKRSRKLEPEEPDLIAAK